ncbi:hypothetical protein [Ilumatobacter sp.]|uniref:hypothetical protein n=1 Tax=Ilumatobacter sp. TaxID=1967498 RepID=UPI003B51E32D
MTKAYAKAEIKDLGAIRDITQGNLNGNSDDGVKITINVEGLGVVTAFGTVSGIPVP